jgi:hypothetical protein
MLGTKTSAAKTAGATALDLLGNAGGLCRRCFASHCPRRLPHEFCISDSEKVCGTGPDRLRHQARTDYNEKSLAIVWEAPKLWELQHRTGARMAG